MQKQKKKWHEKICSWVSRGLFPVIIILIITFDFAGRIWGVGWLIYFCALTAVVLAILAEHCYRRTNIKHVANVKLWGLGSYLHSMLVHPSCSFSKGSILKRPGLS